MLAVEIKNLVKNFGSIRAVDGVSFDVREGEIFGLIGPNAAGKTTTLRIISTLLQPSFGFAKVLGHDVVKEPEKVRRLISYLPEEAGAYKELTGRAYLKFIARFFDKGGNAKKIVDRGVKIADLGGRIDDKVKTYSKGMVRRLLVARALMTEPRLAILDEPTAGLDVTNAREIREMIKRSARGGTTVLLSSHNMLEVEFLCGRIVLIDNGRIVEEGVPLRLKKKYRAENLEEVFTKVVSRAI